MSRKTIIEQSNALSLAALRADVEKMKTFFVYSAFEILSAAGMLLTFFLFLLTKSFAVGVIFAALFIINLVSSGGKAWMMCKIAWGRK